MKKISIERSLSTWLAAQTFLALSAACVAIYAAMAWSIDNKQEEEFQQHDVMVRHAIEEGGASNSVESIHGKLANIFSSHPNFAIEVHVAGKTIYSQVPKTNERERWLWQERSMDAGLAVDGAPVTTRLALDVAKDDALKRQLALTLLGTALLGSLLVSLAGALLVRVGLTPLRRLAKDTGAAGPTQPGRRVQAFAYADELQPWIMQFNALLQRADTAYGQLEKFNAELAQELKAPLLTMVAQIESELRSQSSLESLQDALGTCLEGVQRMSSMMNDMLFLSQADRGAKARRSAPAHLADLVHSVAEFHEPDFDDRGVTYAVHGDAKIALDLPLARRALSILMVSALRNAGANSTVSFWIESSAAGVMISVQAQPAQSTREFSPSPDYVKGASWVYGADREHRAAGAAIVSAITRMHDGYASAPDGGKGAGLFFGHERFSESVTEDDPRSLGKAVRMHGATW